MAKCQKGEPCVPCGESFMTQYAEWRLSSGATKDDVNREFESIRAAILSGYKAKRQSKPRPKGTGSVYQRAGTQYFWCQYAVNKQIIRESTHALTKTEATEYLNKKLRELASGNALDPETGKIKVAALVEAMIEKKRQGILPRGRSIELEIPRWKANVKPVFGELTVKQVTKPILESYVLQRKKAGAANGSINKEISILRSAFKAADIMPVAKWPRLPETNIRKEFLEDQAYDALAKACAEVGLYLRALLAAAVSLGWRRAELITLKVSHVNLFDRTIRLDPGTTKNAEGRTVVMNQETYELISACVAGKKPNDYVFTYPDGSPIFRMELGRPVATFRKSWKKACKAAGVPDLRLHDLRRTSARRNRRLGISEDVIQKMSGWKTRSMFSRYNIVNVADMHDAVKLQDAHRDAAKAKSNYSSDTVGGSKGSAKVLSN
jgi:integrase